MKISKNLINQDEQINVQIYKHNNEQHKHQSSLKAKCTIKLTTGPVLMIGCFLAKLFCQVVQPLQSTDLSEEPLLVAFLCLLQALPGTGYILRMNEKYFIYPRREIQLQNSPFFSEIVQ